MALVSNKKEKAEHARQELAAEGSEDIIVADLMISEGMLHVMDIVNAEHKVMNLLVNAAGVLFMKPCTRHEVADYDNLPCLFLYYPGYSHKYRHRLVSMQVDKNDFHWAL